MTTTAGPAAGRLDHLMSTVARLWPEHDVSLVHSRRRAGSDELALVPNRSAPRLLVPATHRAAAATAVRRFSHALSGRDRAGRLVSATALRLGAGRLLTDRLRMVPRHGAGESVESYLSSVLGQPVLVSLGVGSARANQKPVLQVFSLSGRSLAYVKVGDSDLSTTLVRGEAEALAVLGSRSWRLLSVPRVLHRGTWHDLEVLVMSALDTPARPGPGPALQPPLAALDELYDAFAAGREQLAGSAYWRDLRAAVAASGGDQPRRYHAALDRIADSYGDQLVDLTAWHGDFAPWNLAWHGDRVQLWDWERFATDVPRGLDRVHYVLNTMTRAAGFGDRVVDAALASPHTRHPDCGDAAQQLVVVLYLASITARYLTGSRGSGGEVVRPAAAAMLDALDRHSSSLGRERTS